MSELEALRAENAELRLQLEEAQEVLRAISKDEIDALVVERGGDLPALLMLRQTESALRDSEQRLQLAKEAADLGIYDYDVLQNVIGWDARVREIWGVEDHERISYETFLAGLHPDDHDATNAAVERSLDPDGDGDYFAVFRVINRRDQGERWIEAAGKTYFENGRAVRLIGTVRDVTDGKLVEQQLREADRRKDEFLAILAHELRNPLAPLRNGLQILKFPHLDADSAKQVREMMERQLGQMVRLVDDLLDVSRITRNSLDLRRERVQLAVVLRSALETSRPGIEAAGHALLDQIPDEPLFIYADVTRLAQVFSNLLNNAAKYTEPGGRILLSAARQSQHALVTVKDNGVGIPREMLPKIFDMFTQVHPARESSRGGLGIGLTLVKRLLEMHGGSVQVHSDGPGHGSEFTVTLPLHAELAEQPPLNGHVAPASTPARRILVVDDNRDAAASLTLLLKILGHETRKAHDGAEALALAEEFQPDTLLLDIGLPILNGHEVCKTLRAKPWGRDVMMIALTGWGQEEDRHRSQEAGFDAHLVKPVDLNQLAELFQTPLATV